MPKDVIFRRWGNAVVAIGWPSLVLVGLISTAVGHRDDLNAKAVMAIGAFAAMVAVFMASMFVVGYLPCLRLREHELVIENIFSRVRLAWPLVTGVERGHGLALRSANHFERSQSRAGFAIRDRDGGVHHVGAFRYGIAPLSRQSRLLTRAEAAVNERRGPTEPGLTVIVERPWRRIVVLFLGPGLMITVMIVLPILLS